MLRMALLMPEMDSASQVTESELLLIYVLHTEVGGHRIRCLMSQMPGGGGGGGFAQFLCT